MSFDCTVVLAGNPNAGKTALFNALTGSRQRVGNWSGVTVERKSGSYCYEGASTEVVDLPGVYSTSVACETSAIDEKIACEYLLSGDPDVIVNVIDASNLERNLYLTLQLLEKRIPMVLALNMVDLVKRRGIKIDTQQLSERLGCPVVEVVANKRRGLDALKKAIQHVRQVPQAFSFSLPLPETLRHALQEVSKRVLLSDNTVSQSAADWLALRLLENDFFARNRVSLDVQQCAAEQLKQLEQVLHEDADIVIADARYTFINDLTQDLMTLFQTARQSVTERIDRVVLNRFWGIPFFFFVMYLMFVFSINIGGAFQDFFDLGSAAVFIDGTSTLLMTLHAPAWLTALVAQGIGTGINTVVTFIPVLGAMFLFLALLEDSGYMARGAFVMDRFMQAIGLPGKSFVPMIVGFGCNVPAVMGARTLANRRDRVLTVMMMPFMSCGARLAIFSVFASAFFPTGGAVIIFSLYLMGIVAAVLTGWVLRKTLLPGKPAPLVMELPPYHVPQLGALCRHAWQRLKGFLFRAGKVIVPVCVIIGALNSVTITGELTSAGGGRSLLSDVGRVLTPVFSPMGLDQDNWEATVGLVTGILAKEVVVGTLNTLYSESSDADQSVEAPTVWGGLKAAAHSISDNLSGLDEAFKNPIAASESAYEMGGTAYGVMEQRFDGKVGAFAYLLFVLLYFPCVSTMATMKREVGRRWMAFSVVWSVGIAYVLSVMCYQGLTVSRHPIVSVVWMGAMAVLLGVAVWCMHRYAKADALSGEVAANKGKV